VADLLTTLIGATISGSVIAAIIAGLFKLVSDNASSTRSLVQSIWAKMDSNMTSYYFPLATASSGLSSYLSQWVKNQAERDLLLGGFY